MNKKLILPMLLLVLCCTGVGGYFYLNVDMTGAPYEEIAAYQEAHPQKNVSYTVTITGDSQDLLLTNEDFIANCTHPEQAGSLLEQADYLQHLKIIRFPEANLTAQVYTALTTAFPHTEIQCDGISFLDSVYPLDTTEVDLSDLTHDQLAQAAEGLNALPMLRQVDLLGDRELSQVSLEDAAALHSACPTPSYRYALKLFGQTVSTEMERVEYFRANIKDEGLEQFRMLLPLMDQLSYLKLDWCGTTDEAMARLRDDFPEVKIVWRIFFHEYNCLTDTLKIWANWTVNDMNNSALQYCTDVKYLDLGHTMITHCEWARNMPDLEVVIMGDCNLKSVEPLRNCKKITFLEIFSSKVTDLSPLADLKELKYLNISNLKIDNISPLYELDNMIKINGLMNNIPADQVEEYHKRQPQCVATFLPYGDPTMYDWRYDINGHILPRYELLRQQFGYSAVDYSRYPTGYVTEEITYESTGITPPEAEQ